MRSLSFVALTCLWNVVEVAGRRCGSNIFGDGCQRADVVMDAAFRCTAAGIFKKPVNAGRVPLLRLPINREMGPRVSLFLSHGLRRHVIQNLVRPTVGGNVQRSSGNDADMLPQRCGGFCVARGRGAT